MPDLSEAQGSEAAGVASRVDLGRIDQVVRGDRNPTIGQVLGGMASHPALTISETDVGKEAKRTCDRYVWSKETTSP